MENLCPDLVLSEIFGCKNDSFSCRLVTADSCFTKQEISDHHLQIIIFAGEFTVYTNVDLR